MTRRTRTIIFLACFLLFISVAPSAVLYSQGYRFDFENKKFTQTGGFFLKTVPRQADVYIEGKLNKKTDFFFGSALVENLLPKRYKIEVKKEGYHSWEKTLEIKEKEVIEAKNIVLFPQDVNFNVLSGQTEQFWFSPDQKRIILKEKEKLGWALKLYDLEKNIKSHLIKEEDIFAEGTELVNLTFSEDSKRIYLEASAKERIEYFVLELDRLTPLLTEIDSPPLPIENAIVYRQINNNIYYLDDSGYLFENEGKLASEPFPVKQETKYILDVFQKFIFLQEENDILYKFNPDLKTFEIFFEKIQSSKISPDNRKLAYFSDHEIWTLLLNDKNDPPQKKTGDKVFLMRLSEKITDVFWLNDNYLIFIAGDKIKISEIDDRDRLNIIDIFEIKKLPQNGSAVKMFWNQFDKKLYLLSENNLYGSGALLP